MDRGINIVGSIGVVRTAFLQASTKIVVEEQETKTVHEILEEQRSIKITRPPVIPFVQTTFKDGQQNRRERRDAERKAKKNRKR